MKLTMILQDCKIDACIDRFIACLKKLPGDKKPTDWRTSSKLNSFRKRNPDEFKNLATELENNLRRLVPGCLGEGNILENELLSSRIDDKLWADRDLRWLKQDEQDDQFGQFGQDDQVGQDNQDQLPNKLPKSMLPMLAEKQYRVRTEHVEDTNTLLDSASTMACRQLKESIDTERTAASFACGGKIPIGDFETSGYSEPVRKSSPPVNVLWATGIGSMARRLFLPLSNDASSDLGPDTLHQLVADCDPATFGRGDEDVLDPEYRKAGKLDPRQFATSFHPADFGIIENIEQILLPSISTDIENRLQFRKLSAELYKLNVRR